MKARALVADHLGGVHIALAPFPGGAAALVDGDAWVLLDADPARGLGGAIAWAATRQAPTLNVMVDDVELAGLVARRAELFRTPIDVWRVDGRALVAATPAPIREQPLPPPEALELISVLERAGVDVSIEHGEIRGELRGLEIARVVSDADGARLEVGVGRHDRESFTLVHGNLPTEQALQSVIDSVDAVRRAYAEAHPLRRLAPEGWLRWRVVAEPSLVGARELRPVAPPVARESVKDSGAAIAFGVDHEGRSLVVACSVGIDLDVVPTAADARLSYDASARLLIVVPERDDHPMTRRLASMLLDPAEVVTVSGDWRALS